MKPESAQTMIADSDRIFTAITSGSIKTFEEANRIVAVGYIMDLSFSRSGISHALKRLQKHFSLFTPKTEAIQKGIG